MNLSSYEITTNVEGTVVDTRMATSEEEAADFSKQEIEDAIAKGLREALSGGESSFDVKVEKVRKKNQ